MGDRATCLVCNGYTTAIREAFLCGNECPYCGSSAETTRLLEQVNRKKQDLQKQKVEKELIEENVSLRTRVIEAEEKARKAQNKIDSIKYKFEDLYKEFNEQINKFCKVEE